jgi:hypothetical protein
MRTGVLVRVTLKRIEKNQTEETTEDPISQLQKVAIFRTGSERDYLSLSENQTAFFPSKVGCKHTCHSRPCGLPPFNSLEKSHLPDTRPEARSTQAYRDGCLDHMQLRYVTTVNDGSAAPPPSRPRLATDALIHALKFWPASSLPCRHLPPPRCRQTA